VAARGAGRQCATAEASNRYDVEVTMRAAPASTYRSCPVCQTEVRDSQVVIRRHRGALACYAVVVFAGFAAGWLAVSSGLFNGRPAGVVAAAMIPLLALATRLGWVRVVRCPQCAREQRARIGRR
jgi:hypothetical protein